ncbi:MAG: hypothetical protein JWN17_2116 [Frankiales bacterium]|nr:hypothetical protein [Frankiales bacterium]
MAPDDLVSVRLRLLPWLPRWRTGDTGPDIPSFDGLGDDPISAVVGVFLLLLALPGLVVAVVGVVLLSAEVLLLLALLPLLLSGQLLGLRPWVLVLRSRDRQRTPVEVLGTAEVLRRRRALRAQRVRP